MILLIIVILVILLLGGGWGYSNYGYASFSPLVALAVILLILWALGVLR